MAPSGDNKSVNIGGNVTGSLITTGNNNRIRMRDISISVPPVESVDARAEFASLRDFLISIQSEDRKTIQRALEDADDELSKEDPSKDKISEALTRAVKYSKRANEFGDNAEKIAPRIVALATWLGHHGQKLLDQAGISF